MSLNRLLHELHVARSNYDAHIKIQGTSQEYRETKVYWQKKVSQKEKAVKDVGKGTIARAYGKRFNTVYQGKSGSVMGFEERFEIFYIGLTIEEAKKLVPLDITGVSTFEVEIISGRTPRKK